MQCFKTEHSGTCTTVNLLKKNNNNLKCKVQYMNYKPIKLLLFKNKSSLIINCCYFQRPPGLTYRVPNHRCDPQLLPVLPDPDSVVCKGEGGQRLVESLQPHLRGLHIGHQGHLAPAQLSAPSKLWGKRTLSEALARKCMTSLVAPNAQSQLLQVQKKKELGGSL